MSRMPVARASAPAPLVVVAALVAACGGSSTSAPPTLVIQKTATASGDGQSDTVLSTLPNPLRVVVTLGGAPQANQTVTWATPAAGASVSPLTSVTDASGVATTTWMLGPAAGTEAATATLAGATGSPLTFNATATPGHATQLGQPSGDGQTTVRGTTFPQPLTVTIADQHGNGVPGVSVVWQVTTGTAGVSPANATSGASGVAQTTVTAGGTGGAITITATSTGLTGSPATFNATVDTFPATASVTVGPGIVFTSVSNGSFNPAVDTIGVGGTVTWTWASGSVSHNVESLGSPSFTSSPTQTTGTYSFRFVAAGTYAYNCIVHGNSMTGTVVVK